MRLLLALSFFIGGLAQAATLDIGNVAPGAGEVRLSFAGGSSSAGLSYLEFARTEHPLGPLVVTALGAGDRVVAHGVFEFESHADVAAMLVLIGNGTAEAPYALRLYDGLDDGRADTKAVQEASISLHHLAPFTGATTAADFEAVLPCAHTHIGSAGSGSSGSRVGRYEQSATSVFHGNANMTCNLKTAHPSFGSFDIPVVVSNGTLRFLLVGDGLYEPKRVLVLENGVVKLVAAETAPAVAAVIRSTAFWYDLARPAQGVSLYELKGSDDVFGTWFTHDDAGQPVWYLFNGVATGVPGQRDLIVQAPTRDGAGFASLGTTGTARLFYIDCNQAELRVQLGRDYFTLRLRRSREVIGCDALD
jgi:hypothetical protein